MIQPLKHAPSVWSLCWVDVPEPLPIENDFFLPTILLVVGSEFEPLAPPGVFPELDQVQAEEWLARVFDDLGAPDQLLVWKAEEWVAADWKYFGRDWKTKVKIIPAPPHEARLHSQLIQDGGMAGKRSPRHPAGSVSAGLVRNIPRLRSARKRRATAEKAAEIDPSNTDALALLAEMDFHAGRYEQSFALAGRIEQIDAELLQRRGVDWWNDRKTRPLLRALNTMMLCQWHLGRFSEAAQEGRRMLKIDPQDHMGVRFYIPLFLLLAGQNEDASAFFRRYASEYSHDMPNAWLSFAWALTLGLEGDDQGARKKYREGMLANIYLAPRLLGERMPPDNIFHPGERDEPHSALEFAGSFGDLWDREASTMRTLRDAYVEMRPILDDLVARRANLADMMDQRYDPDYRAKWTRMVDEEETFVRKIIETGGE